MDRATDEIYGLYRPCVDRTDTIVICEGYVALDNFMGYAYIDDIVVIW